MIRKILYGALSICIIFQLVVLYNLYQSKLELEKKLRMMETDLTVKTKEAETLHRLIDQSINDTNKANPEGKENKNPSSE